MNIPSFRKTHQHPHAQDTKEIAFEIGTKPEVHDFSSYYTGEEREKLSENLKILKEHEFWYYEDWLKYIQEYIYLSKYNLKARNDQSNGGKNVTYVCSCNGEKSKHAKNTQVKAEEDGSVGQNKKQDFNMQDIEILSNSSLSQCSNNPGKEMQNDWFGYSGFSTDFFQYDKRETEWDIYTNSNTFMNSISKKSREQSPKRKHLNVASFGTGKVELNKTISPVPKEPPFLSRKTKRRPKRSNESPCPFRLKFTFNAIKNTYSFNPHSHTHHNHTPNDDSGNNFRDKIRNCKFNKTILLTLYKQILIAIINKTTFDKQFIKNLRVTSFLEYTLEARKPIYNKSNVNKKLSYLIKQTYKIVNCEYNKYKANSLINLNLHQILNNECDWNKGHLNMILKSAVSTFLSGSPSAYLRLEDVLELKNNVEMLEFNTIS